MSESARPVLAWSHIRLDPLLAELAGIEGECVLPVWSVHAGEGVPQARTGHGLDDLLRGLAVGYGEGPPDGHRDWAQVHADLLQAMARIRGYAGGEQLLLSTAMDFRREGFRREAVQACEAAVALAPDSAAARSQLIVGLWFLVCDQLVGDPGEALARIDALYPGLDLDAVSPPRTRALASFAYLVARGFLAAVSAGDAVAERRAREAVAGTVLDRGIREAERKGYVDLARLCAAAEAGDGEAA